MKSMRVEILFLIIVMFVGIAANTTHLAYGPKNAVSYPVIYPKSVGAQDGWVLESGEYSNLGGSMNSTATTIIAGDDVNRKQYRSILHFNTSALPDTAIVTNAVLRIRRQSISGTNPFTALGAMYVDMRKPYFGGSSALAINDFQATAGRSAIAIFNPRPVSNWYKATLSRIGRTYINRTGATQFRLYFKMDDNNNKVADNMKFFSGNYTTTSLRPTLEIQYWVP
jgi:hypothetical protein